MRASAKQFPVFDENMRQVGFARFLAPLHEQILETRGAAGLLGPAHPSRLIAEIFASLKEFQPTRRVWRNRPRFQTLWCRVSFWSWGAVGGI